MSKANREKGYYALFLKYAVCCKITSLSFTSQWVDAKRDLALKLSKALFTSK